MAYFDLLGLPPTPAEVEALWTIFAGRLCETGRLAARRPHYGERWARHWLDVARFAESARLRAGLRPADAYRYRDFVIKALNEDMPYDQFVRWQLAGDELAPDDPLAPCRRPAFWRAARFRRR